MPPGGSADQVTLCRTQVLLLLDIWTPLYKSPFFFKARPEGPHSMRWC